MRSTKSAAAWRRVAARRRDAVLGAAFLASAFLGLLFTLRIYAPARTKLRGVDTRCYGRGVAEEPPDAVPDASRLRPREKSVFFVETSCGEGGAGEGGVRLGARQACAVESAARLNPEASVYVLVTAPVRSADAASWSVAARQLLAYPNVQVARVVVSRFARGTPLHAWFDAGALHSSRWPREHASDVLRYLVLWRFGGTYLDLDVIVTRSLENLQNFAGAETPTQVTASALNFARDGVGRRMASACLQELLTDFRGDIWGYNGPGVITRVAQEMCGTEEVSKMTADRCGGFTVLPPSAFNPIPWRKWQMYFDEANANSTMNLLKDSYGIHVWNKQSSSANATWKSQQPYVQLARRFCPLVYSTAGAVF